MATRTIDQESGARPQSASSVSSAWLPCKLTDAASDSLDLIRALAAPFSWLFPTAFTSCIFPLCLFPRAWLVPVERWYPTPAHLLCAASIGAGSLLFTWLVLLVTETKTDVARAKLNRLFG
jgi:hypothetical protein